MTRYTMTINSTADRERAAKILAAAPFGSRFEIKAAQRTQPQNDKMWAMLTEVAQQLPWHGRRLRPDDWKLLFMDALKRELVTVPSLDGNGFVNLSQSSSDLSKAEMGDLIELIYQFGVTHGVRFADG